TGHWVQWERAAEFNAATIAFLSESPTNQTQERTLAVESDGAFMSATTSQTPPPSVYGAVQLGYVIVDSPRFADWKRFAAEGIGMAIGEATPTTLAFRTDAHARRLIVRMSAKEDIALGWQVGDDAALQTILARLAARKIAVEEVAGEEAALRGVAKFWRFLGPKFLNVASSTE